jgi:hypothetical protein
LVIYGLNLPVAVDVCNQVMAGVGQEIGCRGIEITNGLGNLLKQGLQAGSLFDGGLDYHGIE